MLILGATAPPVRRVSVTVAVVQHVSTVYSVRESATHVCAVASQAEQRVVNTRGDEK